MYVCIMCQCFGVGTSYESWLGLTIPAQGWDVTTEHANYLLCHIDRWNIVCALSCRLK
jgi:hypothetical protein